MQPTERIVDDVLSERAAFAFVQQMQLLRRELSHLLAPPPAPSAVPELPPAAATPTSDVKEPVKPISDKKRRRHSVVKLQQWLQKNQVFRQRLQSVKPRIDNKWAEPMNDFTPVKQTASAAPPVVAAVLPPLAPESATAASAASELTDLPTSALRFL
jgi:hypothetical protein